MPAKARRTVLGVDNPSVGLGNVAQGTKSVSVSLENATKVNVYVRGGDNTFDLEGSPLSGDPADAFWGTVFSRSGATGEATFIVGLDPCPAHLRVNNTSVAGNQQWWVEAIREIG